MKKYLLASLIISSLSPLALKANSDLDDEIDAELARIYGNSTVTEAVNKGSANSGRIETSNSANVPTIQIQVQNQSAQDQRVKSNVVSETKTENQYQAAQNSALDGLKKSRAQIEAENELKVVEKLEASRLEDEKSRTDRVFGGSKKVEIKDVKIERQIEKDFAKEDLRQEIRRELKDEEAKDVVALQGQNYFGALIGMGDYSGVNNVRGSYSLGFIMGKETRPNLNVEGSFLFSEFDVEQKDGGLVCEWNGCLQYPRITRMNQYQAGITAKYQPSFGIFKPYVGGAAAYSFRTFSDVQFALPNNDAQSHAIDLGLVMGLDLVLARDFTVGFDYRTFMNVFNRASSSGLQSSFARSVYNSDRAIESISYSQMGFTLRHDF